MTTRNTKSTEGDTRTLKSQARGMRAQRSVTADESRTQLDGTSLSQAERTAMIRSEFTQEALPKPPAIPGWHLCWLSTTNSYDPVHKRMRLGYMPVSAADVPGFDSFRMKSGEFEGCVSCNEMVLFKVPEDQYQAIMREFHHNMPREEEEALKQQIVRGEKDSGGKELEEIEGEGFQEIVQTQRLSQMFA